MFFTFLKFAISSRRKSGRTKLFDRLDPISPNKVPQAMSRNNRKFGLGFLSRVLSVALIGAVGTFAVFQSKSQKQLQKEASLEEEKILENSKKVHGEHLISPIERFVSTSSPTNQAAPVGFVQPNPDVENSSPKIVSNQDNTNFNTDLSNSDTQFSPTPLQTHSNDPPQSNLTNNESPAIPAMPEIKSFGGVEETTKKPNEAFVDLPNELRQPPTSIETPADKPIVETPIAQETIVQTPIDKTQPIAKSYPDLSAKQNEVAMESASTPAIEDSNAFQPNVAPTIPSRTDALLTQQTEPSTGGSDFRQLPSATPNIPTEIAVKTIPQRIEVNQQATPDLPSAPIENTGFNTVQNTQPNTIQTPDLNPQIPNPIPNVQGIQPINQQSASSNLQQQAPIQQQNIQPIQNRQIPNVNVPNINVPNRNTTLGNRLTNSQGGGFQATPVSNTTRPLNTQLSNSTNNANGLLTSAVPGNRALEGVQTPMVSLQKSAPAEIQVGRLATFRLVVRNVGRVPAHRVTIFDEIPKGTTFRSAKPQPTNQSGTQLTWNLGTLPAGGEKTVDIDLMPTSRGEIGSVARIAFESQAAVRTICTQPKLEIKHTAPPKVLIGGDLVLQINVRNTGDGAATGVVIKENVPEQFEHPAIGDRSLSYPLGTIPPGESRDVNLRLRAITPGATRNVVQVTGDGALSDEDAINVEVVSPKLQLSAKGPNRRFIERQAVYSLAVANLGTAPATNVNMVAKLPDGMKFVHANQNGQYDPRNHAVYWSLVQLPVSEKGEVQLTLLPVDVGTQTITYQTQADLNLRQAKEINVAVEQHSELFFDIDDTADPIEVNSDTIYQIRVQNQGSKAATNVRVQVVLPDSIDFVRAEGPVQHQSNGRSIIFNPIGTLGPKSEVTFRVQAKGLREGDHRVQVKLSSDERREMVAKEESTKVYSDFR